MALYLTIASLCDAGDNLLVPSPGYLLIYNL